MHSENLIRWIAEKPDYRSVRIAGDSDHPHVIWVELTTTELGVEHGYRAAINLHDTCEKGIPDMWLLDEVANSCIRVISNAIS